MILLLLMVKVIGNLKVIIDVMVKLVKVDE